MLYLRVHRIPSAFTRLPHACSHVFFPLGLNFPVCKMKEVVKNIPQGPLLLTFYSDCNTQLLNHFCCPGSVHLSLPVDMRVTWGSFVQPALHRSLDIFLMIPAAFPHPLLQAKTGNLYTQLLTKHTQSWIPCPFLAVGLFSADSASPSFSVHTSDKGLRVLLSLDRFFDSDLNL